MSKGGVPASILWLRRGITFDGDRASHIDDKKWVHSEDSFHDRMELRAELEKMALESPKLAALLDAEALARGGCRDEPVHI